LIANPRLADMLRALLTTMFTQKTAIFAFAKETEEELIALKKMLEAGIIKPVVDKVYSFEQADEAHQKVETEQRLGTIVISSER
jgi:NADPH:quinone reductase-like Zn-dependent oxidoreductase